MGWLISSETSLFIKDYYTIQWLQNAYYKIIYILPEATGK